MSEEQADHFEGIGATASENRKMRLVERFQNICHRISKEYRARLDILEARKKKRMFRDNVASTKKFSSFLEAVKSLGFKQIGETEVDEWMDVQNCRYLRGHEPKDMRMPKQGMLTQFVFGDAEIESDSENS